MKFYLSSKPHKWGFKLYLLFDSVQNYFHDIFFESGIDHKDLINFNKNHF